MGRWAETVIWKASGAPADEGILVNFGLVNDGTNLYALIDSFMGTNPYLIKIDPTTHLEVARFTLTSAGFGSPSVGGVYYDGTYLYVSYSPFAPNNYLIQVDHVTMLEVARWTDTTNDILSTITGDGTFIYVGGGPTPARLYKIDPATMTEVSHWEGDVYDDNRGVQGNLIYSVVYGGDYVFVPTDMVHAPPPYTNWIKRIDISTMTVFGFWASTAWGDKGPMVSDGTDLYFKATSSGTFFKVNQALNPPYQSVSSAITGSAFPIIISGQLYFVVGNGTNAYSIYSVDMITLTVTATKTIIPGGNPSIRGLTSIGSALIVGWTDVTSFPSSITSLIEPVFVPSPPSAALSGNIPHKLVSEGLI